MSSSTNYLVEVKTVQTWAFKTMIEALREIIIETNIDFMPNGIRIVSADPSSTILVYLKLEADKFDKYYCKHKVSAGVMMMNFFKIIRVLSNNDTLTLFIEADAPEKMGIKIENSDKNTVTTYYMNLMEVDHTQFNIPSVEFPSVITMPSGEFNKICRDMSNLNAELIEIKSIDNHLIFSCEGEFASQETIMGEMSNGLNFVKTDSSEIVQGYYNLKHMCLFTKCSNLSPTVEIYMKNNFLMILNFMAGSLGNLRVCISPHNVA